MPEGDSVQSHAERIRDNMRGEILARVGGTAPAVRREAHRLRGSTIEGVEAVGKHLIVDFTGGFSLRVHLGMTGNWRFGPVSGAQSDGPARLVLETSGWSARCYRATVVDVGRTPTVWNQISHLGPDLIDDPMAIPAAVARARATSQDRGVSDVLLDQRIAAGIGNVYRNEILFEAGIHPEHPIGDLSDEQLEWLYTRSSAQMRRNVGRARRTTTGARSHGAEAFVYDRGRRPCRRCGTAIRVGSSTGLSRITYWCPTCQPATETPDPTQTSPKS